MRTKAVVVVLVLGLLAVYGPPEAVAAGAMRNQAGIPIKVITRRDCTLHASASRESDSSACRIFSFWYVLPLDPDAESLVAKEGTPITKDGFYRVSAGDSEAGFKGWIHQDDVVEWHHRQALQFAPRTGRDLTKFYRDLDAAIEATTKGEEVGAAYGEPETTGGSLVLMPLLSAKHREINGSEMEVFEMAFVAGHPAAEAVPATEGATSRSDISAASTVDIVFLVDSTASMEPVIKQVIRSIEKVTKNLAGSEELKERLRFGLVCYRDTLDTVSAGALEYVAKVFCTLDDGADHEAFLAALGSVKEADESSVDYAEDILAGLDLALEQEAVKWNPVGWKQIIIVGDSSLKCEDHPVEESRRNQKNRTIPEILAKAQAGRSTSSEMKATGFVLSSVRVKDPRYSGDHAIGDAQMNQLVAGREYAGDLISVKGGPEMDFSEALSDAIVTKLSVFKEAIIDGKGRAAGGKGMSAAEFPYPVLDLLDAAEGEEPSGAEGLSFASAFATEFNNLGDRLFVPHVFVRKGQLMNFSSGLRFLQGHLEDAGEPGSRSVQDIVRQMQIMTMAMSVDLAITGDMPIDTFLQLLLGFPLKNDIFKISIQDLAAMSQTDYDDWVKSVKACTDTLDALAENPHKWFKLAPDAGERDEHAFIQFADLP